ncbi:hypothetical protein [Humibacillus xanthopallidus]|uniref:Uncharacterized protein n=1 Tax=Humibacillus xanthopallidus TaxID=412689 RepID=A0A543I3I9_9MICO|nr:hypothetical protein [Humibacillus xanthopallidus]TQM65152.1 hypothetical protein FBY41_1537 [Humibacillus xanthopallidus]
MTDGSSYEARLEAKLDPARVRSTLAFAGLFQLTHEMLKSVVIDDVKAFYGYVDVHGGVWVPDDGEDTYRRKVLALVPKSAFQSSLLWLQNSEALDEEEAAHLDEIYQHRHQLTHELHRYLIDPDLEPDVELFVAALETLRRISRFWVQVEADIGTFDEYPDVDLDEVVNGRVALIDLCIQAYTEGLPS